MSALRQVSSVSFVHLRLHSEYSIVDGMVRLDEAVAAAAADRMPALALTDLSNVFGMVKFYKAARSKGIKPIIGCDVWVTHDSERDAPHRLLLLCQSRVGYLKLADWLTRAYRTNQYRGRAEMRRAWFAEGTDGLIALSGFAGGDVGHALAQGSPDAARVAADAWAKLFPDRFYLEVQRAGRSDDDALTAATVRLASERSLPVVATHPVQFATHAEFRAHEARVCIAEGYVLSDPRRPKRYTPEQYFTTQDEMARRFADLPGALANSVAIAQRCNLTLPLGKNYLPAFPTPDGVSLEQHLHSEASIGLEQRLNVAFAEPEERERMRPEYVARLEFEVKTIIQMGYAGYFLIVADFINWAKRNGVPVGPGRGSGAGSLVAYSLGITDLDPLRYTLLFERFLNPERVSMPDFDIDFCQDGRDRVIDYVKQKYGAESVSQIVTFGTMAARAVVRDVGRVLDLPYTFCDGIAKLIPFQPGRMVTLKRRQRDAEAQANVVYARDVEPLINEREAAEEEVRELLSLAEQLEGLARNVGMHAGGVLIAPGKLTDFCPLYTQAGSDAPVSQFDKDDVELVGLVKFDFLGLTTLTILDWTLRYIRKLDPASTVALETLPIDDKAAYDIFKNGNTTGVFQFESRGMRELLLQAPPKRFDDVVALVALYRPGPMELIPDYVRRKQGAERFEYHDARLEPILSPTYGVMVYQEQVMQIAQVIGGYTLGAADLLRRAMGKKLPDEMAKHRQGFVCGAIDRGLSSAKAMQLFDHMEKFAGYGFNKSHAAAYALIAYQTAYFKAHHPAAFMAANLSLVMDDTDKVRQFYVDALALGLEMLPPDVNASSYRFEPVDERRVRYGLGGVKGTGRAATEAIVAARAQGPFVDLFDFCCRVDKRVVNRRAVEALIRAGALDTIDSRRASLLASVGPALDHAEHTDRSASQVSLFGEHGGDAGAGPALISAREWTETERLVQEKASLGFYLSGHPYHAYAMELTQLVQQPLSALRPSPTTIRIAGVVAQLRTQSSRRGKMAFVILDDGKDQCEVAIFNETFDAYRHILREDALLVAEVKVIQRTGDDGQLQSMRIVAESLHDLAGARRKWAHSLKIACNGSSSAERLLELLTPFRSGASGAAAIIVNYQNRSSSGDIELGSDWRVNLDDRLLESLRERFSPENVHVVY